MQRRAPSFYRAHKRHERGCRFSNRHSVAFCGFFSFRRAFAKKIKLQEVNMTNYSGIQKLLVFLLLFFSAGASLGIVTLLGPVAYATKILREYKTDPDIEKIIVKFDDTYIDFNFWNSFRHNFKLLFTLGV